MKILIDIPEEVYECCLPFKGAKIVSNDCNYLPEMTYSIANGTPLPKGHGRLIDADNIKTAFPCGEYVRTESVRATIDHEQTIIEADKAESEDKE